VLELIARAFIGIEFKIPLNVYAVYQCSTFYALLLKGEAKPGEDEHPSGVFRGSSDDGRILRHPLSAYSSRLVFAIRPPDEIAQSA
jgi:hypothetical protein